MRELKSLIFVLFVAFFPLSCLNEAEFVEENAPFPEIEEIPLLVIHHQRNGNLINYLAFPVVPTVLRVLVEPADENQELFVTVLGAKRHELLQRSFSISSKVGKGHHGKVTVIVENGLAVSIDGNGFHSPALVTLNSLGVIEEALAGGEMASTGASTIRISNEKVE